MCKSRNLLNSRTSAAVGPATTRGDHARHQGTLLDPLRHLDAAPSHFPLTFSIGNVGSEGVPHMSHQAALSVVRPRFWPPAMITHDITRASGCCQSQTRHRNDIIGRSRRLFFHMVILGLAGPLICLVSARSNFVRRSDRLGSVRVRLVLSSARS